MENFQLVTVAKELGFGEDLVEHLHDAHFDCMLTREIYRKVKGSLSIIGELK